MYLYLFLWVVPLLCSASSSLRPGLLMSCVLLLPLPTCWWLRAVGVRSEDTGGLALLNHYATDITHWLQLLTCCCPGACRLETPKVHRSHYTITTPQMVPYSGIPYTVHYITPSILVYFNYHVTITIFVLDIQLGIQLVWLMRRPTRRRVILPFLPSLAGQGVKRFSVHPCCVKVVNRR